MRKQILFSLAALMLLSAPPTRAGDGDLAALKAKYARPDAGFVDPTQPTDPLSAQKIAPKVALGKRLFFDPVLSGNNQISCASCHDPKSSWQDPRGRSIGAGGVPLGRATPTIMDAAWRNVFMWDGRFTSLEQQAWGPIRAAAEMNQDPDELVRELSAQPSYRQLFDEAFAPSAINQKTIAAALAAFERTVRSPIAPFDRWVQGDDTAISAAAVRGFKLFNGQANCKACHSGWTFTDNQFHDIGLPGDDLGRGALEPDEGQMQRAFKTPTLRNVGLRGPYMHDGSKKTLVDVLDHYKNGIILRDSLSNQIMSPRLSVDETADLISFLNTLNGSGK